MAAPVPLPPVLLPLIAVLLQSLAPAAAAARAAGGHCGAVEACDTPEAEEWSAIQTQRGPTVAAAAGELRAAPLEPPPLEDVNASCSSCVQRHNGPHSSSAQAGVDGVAANSGITISWFGQDVVKYLVGATIVSNGRGFVLTEDPFVKVYLMNKPVATSSQAADFAYLPLAGNSITMNVDMGDPGASCGCNVGVFLVSMPTNSPGHYGDHYCDANCVGGNCCPEFDLIEMNVHALQATSHPCSNYRKPPAAYATSQCDHLGGPWLKFGNGAHDFGPGDGYCINSRRPFEFKMVFPFENGVLKGYTTLSQNGKQVTHHMGDLDKMRGPLTDGMVLVADAWHATDLAWLDGKAPGCHVPEHCNLAQAVTTFDNIVIEKLR